MKTLAIIMVCAATLALFMKIKLHFKLLEPQKRNFGELGKYLGLNFLFPVIKSYTSGRLQHRKINANRLLIIFYSCTILAVLFFLMRQSLTT